MFDDHPDALFAMVRESEDDVADDVCHRGLYKGYLFFDHGCKIELLPSMKVSKEYPGVVSA